MTRVSRWSGAVLATVVLVGLGLLTASPTPFVAAVVPLTYLGYGYLSAVPAVEGLEVTRTVEPTTPGLGDEVTVRLSVTNGTGRSLTDVRLIDGVPDELAVVDGSPRGAFALRPGATGEVAYTVVARRGQFEFAAPAVRLRGLAGSTVVDVDPPVDGDAELECVLGVESVPMRDRTTPFPGLTPTDSGGPGIEFHSTREYRSGDPMSRVNWRGLAKTGDLTTVDFRERRAADVVVVADLRDAVDVAASNGLPTARELAAYGAVGAVDALLRDRHTVGGAALGVTDPRTGGIGFVDPGTGPTVRARVVELFGRVVPEVRPDDPSRGDPPDDARAPTADADRAIADGGSLARSLARRLPPDVQVVLFSPLADDIPLTLASELQARNHPVTVVAPDHTVSEGDDESHGRRLAALERRTRVRSARTAGASVVDWPRGTPLALAIERAVTEVRGRV